MLLPASVARLGARCVQVRRRLFWPLAACLNLLMATQAYGVSTEHELKAAYLARFTEFIEWPPAASAHQDFAICVFGDSPILEPLARLPQLVTVKTRTISVRRIDEPRAAADCDVAFIPATAQSQLPAIRAETEGKPVLTVNEIPVAGFAGSLISLYAEGDRLRFAIHLTQARAAGFKISARLLKLARVYE